MPRFPNKQLQNENTTLGNQEAIKYEYATLGEFCAEILKYNIPLDQFDDLEQALEVECDRHTKSDDEHVKFLREMNTKVRHRIRDFLKANPTIRP